MNRNRIGLALFSFWIASSAVQAAPARSARLQCIHLPQIIEFYLRQHYSQKKLTDAVKQRTVEQLIRNLDPSKTHLLEADVDKLKTDLMGLFPKMSEGKCTALDEAFQLLVNRAKENEVFVAGVVNAKDFKVNEALEFVFDPKKRGYAKTKAEREAFLLNMVHFQMLNYQQAQMKMPEAKKQMAHRYELITKRIAEKKEEDRLAAFNEAFALALDPHSSFLTRDNLEDFEIHMHLSLEGIGATLTSQDGLTVIEELIPGGGAEKSKKLKPKDKILSVAQEGQKPVPIIDMDLREVVKLIRGKKGTKVTLGILRQGPKTENFDATIVRDKIDIKESAAKLSYEKVQRGDKSYKVAIIDLPSFYGGGEKGSRSCSADVRKLLDEAKKEKSDAVVLNLSGNGGGLLEEAVKISGLFLKTGGVVATKDSETRTQVIADQNPETTYQGPLVVLTSRYSASASEILAGALKDYNRAIVVGADHTFGKGSVQVISPLPLGLGAMKVTTGMFFLPAGQSTQLSGVSSHIILPSVINNDEVGEGSLDYALPSQSIPNFVSNEANGPAANEKWAVVDGSTVKKLAEKSTERVSKSPKFAEVYKNIEEAKKNKGLIRLAEMKKKDKDKKDKKDKKTAGVDGADGPDDKESMKEFNRPYLKEASEIAVDWLVSSAPTRGNSSAALTGE